MTLFSSEKDQYRELVLHFPEIVRRAVLDYALYKAGLKAQLFTAAQSGQILRWFSEFSKLWVAVRPNFAAAQPAESGLENLFDPGFTARVDRWVESVTGLRSPGLGIAPLIIAGVVVAGILGLAGSLWAVSHWKEQANISRLIEETVAGRLPTSVLQEAVNQESSLFAPMAEIGSWVKWLGLGLLAWFALPLVLKLLRGRSE